MLRALLLLCMMVLQAGLFAQSTRYDILIRDITIIDVLNKKEIPHKDVFIRQGKITKVINTGSAFADNADTIINASGKFLLPGFWDMHIHACWKENLYDSLFPVLLSYGITGVRDMGGDAKTMNDFKSRSLAAPGTSPVIFGAGPILDGEKPVHADFSAALTADNFRFKLDSIVHQFHVDFFKVYSLLPKNIVDSIATYAKKNQLAFAGHISEYISPIDAITAGQKSVEHLNRLEELTDDPALLNAFIKKAKQKGSWFCPTMIIYKRKSEITGKNFFYHSLYDRLDNDLKTEWEQVKNTRMNKVLTEADKIKALQRYQKQKELVKKFYDSKLNMMIGDDFAGMPFIYPGYSLHEEMALLQSIGIAPFDILKMATYNPAVYFNIEKKYGTVESGKIADVVIFDKNPATDINNTLQIHAVIKSGKIFPSIK